VIAMTLTYIERLFAGKASVDQLSGPIGIAKMSGEAAKVSFSAVLALAGLLSVSVGFLNLLPIPMLDGGHLALYAIEAVRGRAPSPRFLDHAFRIGFALVIAFSLWTVFLDISRVFYR
jgi:regulator of sigma E protease